MTGLIPKMWLRTGEDELPPQKRISTPAGMRLSVIMNEVRPGPSSPRGLHSPRSFTRPQRLSITKGTTIVVSPPEDEEQQGEHAKSTGTASPGYSNFSDKSVLAEIHPLERRLNETPPSKRKSKKLLWILIVAVILLLALIVGLAVGLSRKHTKSSTAAAGSGTSSNNPSSTGSGSSSSSSTSIPVTVAKDFPLGSYSVVTFLDTVLTNCTSNPATWTCAPYTLFNDNAAKSMATFNWAITAGSTSGTYQVSSTDNSYGVQFSNIPLTLVGAGQSSEKYQFHAILDKVVSTTVDGSAATCYYNSTTFQGTLYTKMAKDYPLSGQAVPSGGHPLWPFAARLEQIAGRDSAPNCFKSENGQLGARITDVVTAPDGDSLCDCLYKNWRTPTPA